MGMAMGSHGILPRGEAQAGCTMANGCTLQRDSARHWRGERSAAMNPILSLAVLWTLCAAVG
jgi:hypothetical protein